MLSTNFLNAFVETLRAFGYNDWDIRCEWRAFELLRRLGVYCDELGWK